MHIVSSHKSARTRSFCKFLLCSLLLAFSAAASAQQRIWYVSPLGGGDGTAWDKTTTFSVALQGAKPGDQIWLQGYETITSDNQYYKVPAANQGYTLPAGISLYGGFKGGETDPSERVTLGKAYDFRYRTSISGDFLTGDKIDETTLFFPPNESREDNAPSVLTVRTEDGKTTLVNGLSISGGQGVATYGGGIRVEGKGDYLIEQCFLAQNYALLGGAVYVAPEAGSNVSRIDRCAIFNNAAGTRSAGNNAGAGVYLAGSGAVYNTAIFNNQNGGMRISDKIRVINSTVARNSAAGIDLIEEYTSSLPVQNTVIWGNTYLYVEHSPKFEYCAYHEVVPLSDNSGMDADHNVFVSDKNQGFGNSAPFFESSSYLVGYDRTFDWRIKPYPEWSWALTLASVLVDKGNDDLYPETQAGQVDITKHRRISGSGIDIGAAEYQAVGASRIRYVREKVYGNGSGTSWDNATNDLQKAIDELAQLLETGGSDTDDELGEVWVAGGTYSPIANLDPAKTYTASFRMRDGISVYGGFNPDQPESQKDERQKPAVGANGHTAMSWEFATPTILQGSNYGGSCTWNSTARRWELTGESRHVVWFAPFGGKSDFEHPTILDGVQIRGGNAVGDVGRDDFATHRGGGIYMKGSNTLLSNSIVSMSHAADKGGGVYLSGGRIISSLIYNCNADGDGGAVYVEEEGLVLRSALTNNSAQNGAGIYMAGQEGSNPGYMILSTSVVSNNTSRSNAAVYARLGGVVLHSTITNNDTPRSTDAADQNASQTGGFYADEYGLMVSSVLWNNRIAERFVPMYAKSPTPQTVRFMNVAVSGSNNAIWNNTLQQDILMLADRNNVPREIGLSRSPSAAKCPPTETWRAASACRPDGRK